ncbi:MAG: hypothetical protein NTU89_00790 [Candidatus Dependentiae bacterium]|nr:hypothetical protein [Candidatus Dependentiae bacterium]
MSHAAIKNWDELQDLLEDPIFLSGNTFSTKEEISNNIWSITFDQDFVKTIQVKDLEKFISQLLSNRSEQINNKFNAIPATFYLWYDAQSVQLKFNILSGKNIKLPFGCKLNILNSPMPIFQKFLDEAQAEINPLDFQNFTFLNPGDPGFEEEEEDTIDWILDVYVTILPQSI